MKRVQVAVVGGGPAGLAAAIAAGDSGAVTILFEEQGCLGGWPTVLGPQAVHVRAENAGVELRRGTLVWGLFPENLLGISNAHTSFQLQAEQVILATGSTDLPCPFPGASLPGVFTATAMRVMLREWRVMPGKRFIVVGDNFDATVIADEIESLGGDIIARVESKLAHKLAAFGNEGIEAVEIDGVPVDADVVVIASGRQPDIELALMAECAAGFSETLGGFVPIRDENLRTSQAAILVAGDAAGICYERTAMTEGRFAGISAAHELGLVDDVVFEEARAMYVEHECERVRVAAQLIPSYVQV